MINPNKLYTISEILSLPYSFTKIANLYKRVRNPRWGAVIDRGQYKVKGEVLLMWRDNPPYVLRGRKPIKK